MRTRALFISLAAFSIAANAFAASSDLGADEVALIGRWQQGLTADLRSMPQQKQSILTSGDVLDFTADHAFRLYPKCGREKAAWEKRGVSYLGGSWKITAANKLHIVMEAMGKKLERDVDFAIKGDDLIFISASNPHEQFGKFSGQVPQQCPAN